MNAFQPGMTLEGKYRVRTKDDRRWERVSPAGICALHYVPHTRSPPYASPFGQGEAGWERKHAL